MNKYLALLLSFTLALGTLACGQATPSEPEISTGEIVSTGPETSDAAEHIFTDYYGREVTIPQEVTAIVPSGPLAQMVLFAIAPEKLVGLASRWSDDARDIIPEEYLALPYLGQLYSSADLNIEELAMVGPQLIIDIGEAKSSAMADLDDLQAQTGIPTVFFPADLESMPEVFRSLGKLLHEEARGEELALFCEKIYTRTHTIMDSVGDHKKTTLLLGGEEGLHVIARDSYHSEILDLMTENLAVVDNPSSKGLGSAVDIEQIMLWNPEVILFMPNSIYGNVADRTTWRELDAIRSGNYLLVPDIPHNWMGMPPSVQRYLALIWLPTILYPEHCDYDAAAEIKEFYWLFYHCRLTEDRYGALVEHAYPAK